MIRIVSIVLITLIVGGIGYIYGTAGALIALPFAILTSIATEKYIGQKRPEEISQRRRL